MPSPSYYREQAHRCLLLSRSTVDPKARVWLTDMASYYANKAKWVEENGFPVILTDFEGAGAHRMAQR